MIQASRTFRIFVSSTFSDLKAERNALQEKVFPRLRDLAASHGRRFQAIDLRWGVSEEAALDQQAMKICLAEVERCQTVSPRPNFIILLGNRYGWRPVPYEIAADEFEPHPAFHSQSRTILPKDWYQLDENAVPPVRFLQRRTGNWVDPEAWDTLERQMHGLLKTAARDADLPEADLIKYQASATEQEIIHGAFQAMNAREHIFCFTRETAAIPPDDRAKGFIDLVKGEPDEPARSDEKAAEQLQDLKARLKDVLAGNYHEYPAQWEKNGPSQEHLDRLCQDVYECLARIILAEIEHPQATPPAAKAATHIQTDTALDPEGLAHARFAEEAPALFCGAHRDAGEDCGLSEGRRTRQPGDRRGRRHRQVGVDGQSGPADPGVTSKGGDRLPLHRRHPRFFGRAQPAE